MATKDQERKALEQIKKIVAELGGDSYIGMAFEGCFEIAEENIKNDFACSMRQRVELAQEKADHFRQIADEKDEVIEKLEKKVEQLGRELKQETERANKYINSYMNDRKDIRIETKDDSEFYGFKSMRLNSNKDFRFITVERIDGWMTSYKLDDINEFDIY